MPQIIATSHFSVASGLDDIVAVRLEHFRGTGSRIAIVVDSEDHHPPCIACFAIGAQFGCIRPRGERSLGAWEVDTNGCTGPRLCLDAHSPSQWLSNPEHLRQPKAGAFELDPENETVG